MYPLYENHSFIVGILPCPLLRERNTVPVVWDKRKTGLFRIAPLHFPCRENGGRTLSPDALASFMFKNQGKIPIYLWLFWRRERKAFFWEGSFAMTRRKSAVLHATSPGQVVPSTEVYWILSLAAFTLYLSLCQRSLSRIDIRKDFMKSLLTKEYENQFGRNCFKEVVSRRVYGRGGSPWLFMNSHARSSWHEAGSYRGSLRGRGAYVSRTSSSHLARMSGAGYKDAVFFFQKHAHPQKAKMQSLKAGAVPTRWDGWWQCRQLPWFPADGELSRRFPG